jgi:hypothetical protein
MDARAHLLKLSTTYRFEFPSSVQVFERRLSTKRTRPVRQVQKRRYARRKASTPL